MKDHAFVKHKIKMKSNKMNLFVRKSLDLSKSSWRFTTKSRVLTLMGRFAQRKRLYSMVKSVLKGHLVAIKKKTAHIDPFLQIKCDGQSEDVPDDFSNSRRKVRHGLSEHGFVVNLSEERLCNLACAYDKLRGASDPAGPRLLHRILVWAKARGLSEVGAFYSTKLAIEFHNEARAVLKPNSVRNHAQTMCNFIGLALTAPTLKSIFPTTKRSRLKKARDEWQKIKNLNEREGRREQRRKMKCLEFKPVPVSHICEFLKNARESGLINQCFNQIEDSMLENKNEFFQQNVPYYFILCVLALYIALTGQRLCAALNLTLSEVFDAVKTEGVVILKIKTHKTSKSMGPARIALKCHQYEDLLRFCKLRREMKTAEDTVLVSPTGKKPSNLMKPLELFLRKTGHFHQKITFNWFRSTIETSLHLSTLQTEAASNCIPAQLGHGVQVAKLHYRFHSDSATVSDSRRVENVLAQLVVIDMLKHTDKSWSSFSVPTTFRGNLTVFFFLLIFFFSKPEGKIFFYLIFFSEPGDFPPRTELEDLVKQQWIFTDLQLHSMSEPTYEALKLNWRNLHREDLVDSLADELADCSSCVKWAVSEAFKYLPDIWHPEKPVLVPRIVEKIRSKQ